MGNTRTIQTLEVSKPLNSQHWKKYKFLSHCQILKNNQTQQEAELYIVTLKGDLLQQYEKYQFRKKQQSNLVSVLSVTRLNSEYLCIPQQKLQVITQRIPYLLTDLQGLSLQESLYVIYQSLIGFKLIYQNIGYIFIHADLIGFNIKGQVKVWLNQNFACNNPEKINQRFAKDNKRFLRKRMIDQLFMIVEQHSQNKKFAPKFNKIIIEQDICDFLDAINIIKDFLIQQDISIPSRLIIDTKKIKKSKKNQIIVNQIQKQKKRINHTQPNLNANKNAKNELAQLLKYPDSNKIIYGAKNQPIKINHSLSQYKHNLNSSQDIFLNKTTSNDYVNFNKNKNISISFLEKKNMPVENAIFPKKIIPTDQNTTSITPSILSMNTSSHENITNKPRVEIKIINNANQKVLARQQIIQRKKIENTHKSLVSKVNSEVDYKNLSQNKIVERVNVKNVQPPIKFKMMSKQKNITCKKTSNLEQTIKYTTINNQLFPQNYNKSMKTNEMDRKQVFKNYYLESSKYEKKQTKSSSVLQKSQIISDIRNPKEANIQDYISNLLSYQDLRIKLLQSLGSPKHK